MTEKITMNAEEYLNTLRKLNQKLWEEVLDTINDHFSKTIPDNDDDVRYYCHTYEDGSIVLEVME